MQVSRNSNGSLIRQRRESKETTRSIGNAERPRLSTRRAHRDGNRRPVLAWKRLTTTQRFLRFVESLPLISNREREVLILFMKHLNDETVAGELGTSRQTVRNQVASMMRKLGLDSREELVATVLLSCFGSRQNTGRRRLPNRPR
jgi:DNA-binding CsgD family transcriptional regulator